MNGWQCAIHVSFFFNGEEFEIPKTRNTEWRTSSVWICQRCGSRYASMPCRHYSDGRLLPYISWMGCCTDCAPFHSAQIPGSIWQSWDHEFLDALPLPVLEREFHLHYEHYQKLGELPRE